MSESAGDYLMEVRNESNASSTDESLEEYVSRLRSEMVCETAVYVCFWLIGSAGNLFILTQLLFKSRSQWSSSGHGAHHHHRAKINFLISHLAVADLTVVWFTMTTEIAWRVAVTWNTGEVGCRVVQIMRVYGLYLTSTIVICISLDRFYAFVYPMSVFNSEQRNFRLVVASYFIAAVASLPNGLVFHLMEHPHIPGFVQCVTMNSFTTKWAELAYNAASVSGFYLIPVIVIVICYSAILRNIDSAAGNQPVTAPVHRKVRSLLSTDENPVSDLTLISPNCSTVKATASDAVSSSHTELPENGVSGVSEEAKAGAEIFSLDSQNRKALMARAKRKTLTLSVSIVVTFVVCWTPYALMLMWEVWDADSLRKGIPDWLRGMLYILACANSCVNPFVHSRHLFFDAFRRTRRRHTRTDTLTQDLRTIRSVTDVKETNV